MTDERTGRLPANARTVTGILVQLAGGDFAAADALIDGIEPDDAGEVIHVLAAMIIEWECRSGLTREQVRATFASMALTQAAAGDDTGEST